MERWRAYRQTAIYRVRKTRPRRKFYVPVMVRRALLVATMIVSLTWIVFGSPIFAIDTITTSGELTPVLSERLMTLRGRNLFRVSERELMTQLQDLDPTVAKIRLTRGLPNELQVIVTRRHPTLIWQVGETAWAVDEEGTALAFDPTLAAGIPQVVDYRSPTVTPGAQLVPATLVQFIKLAFQEVPARIGGKLVRAELHETAVSVKLITEWGWAIYLETTRPLVPQLENLAIVLQNYREQIHEYVDMRVPGWGYVK